MKQLKRNECLKKRASLSLLEKNSYSSIIVDKVIPFLKSKQKVAIYLPMEPEVDVTSLLFMDCEYYAPRINEQDILDFVQIESSQDIKVGKFGILEPQGTKMILPQDLDVVIVPLVGFDESRNRLGYGKGYYDRYLKQTDALKIGVAFEVQKQDEIPVDEHDISLDYIISELKVYN